MATVSLVTMNSPFRTKGSSGDTVGRERNPHPPTFWDWSTRSESGGVIRTHLSLVRRAQFSIVQLQHGRVLLSAGLVKFLPCQPVGDSEGFPNYISKSYSVDARNKVGIYEIQRGNFSLKLTNWGATVISVILPDSQGNLNDVVLGFDTIPSYVNDTTYFGATVGRVANRIDGAQFWMDGHHYRTFPNEGNNTLHGGNRGFSKVIWTVVEHDTGEFPYIKFYYHSFDGEQGFPGDLDVFVTYKIVDDYSLSITMTAEALNKPTPVNLAHHTYWNLAGHDSGDILSNTVQLFASHYTPVDDVTLIPTGELLTVEGTPYDFREPHVIGSRINQTAFGYDFNYALDKHGDENNLRKAAVVKDHKTGRQLELWTNQVGLQFYSGNQLNNVVGKGGHVYKIYGGLCLESQGFPDSVNKVYFPSQARRPGQDYTNHMLYKFSF